MDAQTLAQLDALLQDGGVITGPDLAALDQDVFGRGALGLVWDELSLERVVAHLEPDRRHHQPHGIVHGGVWCGVVESLASIGAALQVIGDGLMVVGVSNTTDFLRSHREGRVDAVAHPVHIGRTQQLWQVVLTRGADGKPIARGQVRLHNLDPAALGN